MWDKDAKVSEARHFLNEMSTPRIHEDREVFGYHLSAFLTASRSILQYALEEARDRGRQTWYDDEAANAKWVGFFKHMRDVNIHEAPARPNATHHLLLKETMAVYDTLRIDHRPDQEPDENEELLSVTAHPAKPDSESGACSWTEYTIEAEGNQVDLMDVCHSYLSEIDAIVSRGREAGIWA